MSPNVPSVVSPFVADGIIEQTFHEIWKHPFFSFGTKVSRRCLVCKQVRPLIFPQNRDTLNWNLQRNSAGITLQLSSVFPVLLIKNDTFPEHTKREKEKQSDENRQSFYYYYLFLLGKVSGDMM